MATPCAAAAASPNDSTIRRKIIWQMLTKTTSMPPGMPIRRMRRMRSKSGRMPLWPQTKSGAAASQQRQQNRCSATMADRRANRDACPA